LQTTTCNLLDFARHGMTAHHLGGAFRCSEFSHYE
jgi:hypothetical protein